MESLISYIRQEILDILLQSEDVVNRVVARRMYCDNCHVFDVHTMEDCPRQLTESSPPHPKHRLRTRRQLAGCPYCEKCRVFGHATADCRNVWPSGLHPSVLRN